MVVPPGFHTYIVTTVTRGIEETLYVPRMGMEEILALPLDGVTVITNIQLAD